MKSVKAFSLNMLLASCLFFLLLMSCKKDENKPATEPDPPAVKAKVYVANEHDGTVSVINADTKKQIKKIPINSGGTDLMAHNVQVAPDGKTVWVTAVPANHNTQEQLVVIDAGADTIKHRIPLNMHLHLAHVVFDDEGKYAFVTATDANYVIQVDAKNYNIIYYFSVGGNHEPHGLRYYNGKLYVANMRASSISVIEVATRQVTEIPVGGMAVQTAVTPDGKYVFASLYDTREVVRYNLQTQELTRIKLPAGAQGPVQLYPSPDSRQIFVADQGLLMSRPASNNVYVIDAQQATVESTITAGSGVHGVVVSSDAKTVYVTNNASNSVSVIDVATKKVTDEIPVGHAPNGISYWSESGGMP